MLNHNIVSRTHPGCNGMSLIEVVLATAVAGFVLASAVSLMVSVSSIWSERSERYFFVDHVDGVTEFLNASLATAGTEITANTNINSGNENQGEPDDDSQTHSNKEPIRWKRPPGFANYQEPLLYFSMAEAPPLLVNPQNAPSLGIHAFLHFEQDEGLSLLWYSILQEQVEDINDLRRTLVSPLVTAINYIYWDERFEQWEENNRPQKDDETDAFKLPRFIKIIFEYEGVSTERTLTIPVPSQSALIF